MRSRIAQSKTTKNDLERSLSICMEERGRLYLPTPFSIEKEDSATPLFEKGTGPNGVDEKKRSVSGVANAESMSRSGIIVRIDGLDVQRYNNDNPVVLAGHEYIGAGLEPGAIGTIERVTKADDKKVLRYKNMTFDTDPISEMWYQKVLKGVIRMTSIGFLPIDWEYKQDEVGKGKEKREIWYIDITQSELLEISVVPVGANRFAVIGHSNDSGVEERIGAAEKTIDELRQQISSFTKMFSQIEDKARSELLSAVRGFRS